MRVVLTFVAAAASCLGQSAFLRSAPKAALPTHIDGNSPAFWDGGVLRLFSSTGNPEMISESSSQFGPWTSEKVDVTRHSHFPLWIEAAWRDDDGTVFGWYHHEPEGLCGGKLTAPKIGAVVSYDGGKTVTDLGIVLESADAVDCNSKNGFFGGGHGDFSVVPDRERNYFYFFFTNYNGPAEEQGVAAARLAFDDRYHPAGAVQKHHRGQWNEPGIGGRVTPVFTAARTWQREDTDSYWGPAVHWNSHLNRFVMLLNRACCKPGWPQEGIYVSFSEDLSVPALWKAPSRILEGAKTGVAPGYYPQVMGIDPGETDTVAGRMARLYVMGVSTWEIFFSADSGGGDAGEGLGEISDQPVDDSVK